MRADRPIAARHRSTACRAVVACGSACLLLWGAPARAQGLPDDALSGRIGTPALGPAVASLDPATAQAAVGEVLVQVERAAFVADGITRVPVIVEVLDRQGQRLQQPVTLTLESSARILLPDPHRSAQTDESGAAARDADPGTRGVQQVAADGRATFWLLAPGTPQDVSLRVTAGAATAEGTVRFDPELRETLAVGLVEGVIALRSHGDTIQPVRLDDGFEEDLRNWSRRFSGDRGSVGARTALFVKGRIRGDALLTLAYESDRQTGDRLLRDVRPDEYYPVFGDSAAKGFDAQSRSRLYVRVDQERSYALYGDFETSANFAPLTGGGAVAPLRLRDLGQYNRTLTGLRAHQEFGAAGAGPLQLQAEGAPLNGGSRGFLNVFASRDRLKQAVEEYAANGTSGPFAVASSNATAGTDKVEIVVRDRNNPAVLLSVTPLVRLLDYVFEPFSGRILLNRPVASLDPDGQPQSIRISYEIDQGGDPFWLVGADGQVRVGERVELGGGVVEDRNRLAPYRLVSANAGVRLGERTQLVVEFARSEGRYNTGSGVDGNLTPGLGTVVGDAAGNAARIALEHDDDRTRVRLYAGRSDGTFDNPAASFSAGRGDAGLRASTRLSDAVTLFGEAVRSEDRVAGGERRGAQLGASWQLNERLSVDLAFKRIDENGQPVTGAITLPANPSSAVGAGNSPLTPSGGFAGSGADALNPATGTTLLTPQTATPSTGAGRSLEATTVQLGAQWHPTDRTQVAAQLEHDVSGDDQRRYALGASYRLAERSRLYGRIDSQRGLASAYALDPAERSAVIAFGADTTYQPGAQFYSEYRLRDALGDTLSTRDAQLATGLRNTWQGGEGITWTTGAERLKRLSGGGQEATALVGGLDVTTDPLWKLAARLELRRLSDDPRTATGNEGQDSVLSTVTLARKLTRDWTLLARNYALYTGLKAGGKRLQDRAQAGVAYRDTDTNRVNALGKVEFKTERDSSGLPGFGVGTTAGESRRDATVFSVLADYHPRRPWWFTGRVAAKAVRETDAGVRLPDYQAWLVGGRVVVDVTERWDLGVLAALLFSPQGAARQHAIGLEAGYLVQTNLWLSVGFNFTGFSDRDLSASDYTNRGVYLRLRLKFDEDLFRGQDPDVNRALERPRQ